MLVSCTSAEGFTRNKATAFRVLLDLAPPPPPPRSCLLIMAKPLPASLAEEKQKEIKGGLPLSLCKLDGGGGLVASANDSDTKSEPFFKFWFYISQSKLLHL